MNARFVVMLMALLALPQIAAADGDVVLSNDTGAVSFLNATVIPGASNTTTFRIAAAGGNVSTIALFYLGDFNISVSPDNISLLPDGDSRVVTVNVTIDNTTAAGTIREKIIILTSRPQRIELPLFVSVPETTGWDITSPTAVARNVSVGEAGLLTQLVVNNSGNVPVIGRVSLVDLSGLVWFDERNFTIDPLGFFERPIYFSVPNGTVPGTYRVNLSLFDSLNNARRMNITLAVPDVTPPSLNVSLSRVRASPNQIVSLRAFVADDGNISHVWSRVGTGDVVPLLRESDAWVIDLAQLPVGNHTVAVFANDTAGNVAVVSRNVSVVPFNYLSSHPALEFLRFRPGERRSLILLSSLQQATVNVTLTALTPANNENLTLAVLLQGEPLIVGEQKQVTFSGDLLLSVESNIETPFSGSLSVATGQELENPNPTIAFTGAVGSYAVTPAQQFVVAGIVQECAPDDVGVYENSSYTCAVRYPVDVNTSALSVTVPKTSYDALIQSNQAQAQFITEERDAARTMNIVLAAAIIVFIAAFILKSRLWDNIHVRI